MNSGEVETVSARDAAREVEQLRVTVQQLERALESRIVIEQAKGILAERYSLSIEDAFGLLRHAARSSQQKLHRLAADVVHPGREPAAISSALARGMRWRAAAQRERAEAMRADAAAQVERTTAPVRRAKRATLRVAQTRRARP